jgi:hypothetical protein
MFRDDRSRDVVLAADVWIPFREVHQFGALQDFGGGFGGDVEGSVLGGCFGDGVLGLEFADSLLFCALFDSGGGAADAEDGVIAAPEEEEDVDQAGCVSGGWQT